MVVAVSNEHFDIVFLFVEYAAHTAGLIEARVKGLLIFEHRIAVPQPGKYFVVEWVNDFYFVIIGISHDDDVLLRNKGESEGVLQLGVLSLPINISVCM